MVQLDLGLILGFAYAMWPLEVRAALQLTNGMCCPVHTVKPGVRYRELGNIIQKHAQANGFSVVRSYCGHGIHKLFHTAPNVPHYASKNLYVHTNTCTERVMRSTYIMLH